MGMFLNSSAPYESYKELAKTRFFVDKTRLIQEISLASNRDGQNYICITRPRRFGKSVAANMLASYWGRAVDSHELFDSLFIATQPEYEATRNQYHVISIDFSRVPRDCSSYEQYLSRIQNGLNQDLAAAYPSLKIRMDATVWDVLMMIFQKTGDKFIFIMDEWDAIFHMPFITQADCSNYLLFLKNLMKDQAYIQLAYMTGVLPISKYSSGSELNMFLEYDMATREKYGEYFGFSNPEVDALYSIYQKTTKHPKIQRSDLKRWYDGYHTASGERMYNPRSVVCAMTDNQLSNYWVSSGPYDEIFYYIRNNIEEVCDDLALMVSGARIGIRLQGYAATSTELNTKNQIYSAMVVYGLLTYEEEEVFIPNKELLDQYSELLLTNSSLGYVYRLARESDRMLSATLSGDTSVMTEILEYAHNTEAPILSYNSEIELSAIINLIYLSARDKYRVEPEMKTGKGFVDFIFYPERKNTDAIILELKIDSTPTAAIDQIHVKKYPLALRGRLGQIPSYHRRILLVGISYDRRTKVHSCKVEVERL